APLKPYVAHLVEALLLKGRVADSEHLVHDKYLGLKVRRDGEGEPHVHARGVELDGRLDELLQLREGDYLVELLPYLGTAHPEYRAVQVYVLAPREVWMEARADFEERADAAHYLHLARARPRDAREYLQERGLARAVVSYDAY